MKLMNLLLGYVKERMNASGSCSRRCASRSSYLEALESRVLLSEFTWQGAPAGNWDDATKWLDANQAPGIPGANDTAIIALANPNANATISLRAAQSVGEIDVQQGNVTIDLAGHNLTVHDGQGTGGMYIANVANLNAVLTVSNSGVLSTVETDWLRIARTGAVGTLVLTGAAVSFVSDYVVSDGYGGVGHINVTNHSYLEVPDVFVGGTGTDPSTLTVDGTGSSCTIDDSLNMGGQTGVAHNNMLATVTLSGALTLSVGSVTMAEGATMAMNTGATATCTEYIAMGGRTAPVAMTFDLTGVGTSLTVADVYVGAESFGETKFIVENGSHLTVQNCLYVGYAHDHNELSIATGATVTANQVVIGDTGTGTLEVEPEANLIIQNNNGAWYPLTVAQNGTLVADGYVSSSGAMLVGADRGASAVVTATSAEDAPVPEMHINGELSINATGDVTFNGAQVYVKVGGVEVDGKLSLIGSVLWVFRHRTDEGAENTALLDVIGPPRGRSQPVSVLGSTRAAPAFLPGPTSRSITQHGRPTAPGSPSLSITEASPTRPTSRRSLRWSRGRSTLPDGSR